jgi:NADH-quinone oxidoreductase subunit E
VKHLIPEFERLKQRLPPGQDDTLLLPALHRIQQDRGHIAEEDIQALVDYLGMPRIQVDEVLSFYGMLRRKAIGRCHIEVCRNVSCSMHGAERLIAKLSALLGIRPGETTTDGRYTFNTVECLGSCGTAPVMMVDGKYHENIDPDQVAALLEALEIHERS